MVVLPGRSIHSRPITPSVKDCTSSCPSPDLPWAARYYKTTDGGQTWKFIQQVFWDGQFSFISMDLGWAYVIDDQGEIALVKTVNGGETWTMLHPLVGP